MQAYSEAMGEFFTTTPVPPELQRAAAAGRRHQGGAEFIVAGVRTHLGLHPDHAVASDDKKNGFNSIYLASGARVFKLD